MIKKLALLFIVFAFLILGALVVLPFVINVDKYRPQILQKVNENIQGKLDLGRLKLSLWGQIRVDIEGLTLADARGGKILSVTDAFLDVPLKPILHGAPEIVLKLNHPAVRVVKDKAGKLNVMTLIKPGTAADTGAASGAPAASQPVSVPGIVARASAAVEVNAAQVTYKDEESATESNFRDINLEARNLSLTRTTDLKIWGNLDTQVGTGLHLRGPIKVEAHATPKVVEQKLDSASVDANLDLNELEIRMPGLLEKKKGVRATAEFQGSLSGKSAAIQKFYLRFHNAEVSIAGGVQTPASPVMDLTIKSNSVELKPWSELIPLLKQYELGGSASFNAEARGPTAQIQYRAELRLDGVTTKAPMLKAQPRFDGMVKIVTDQIESLTLSMNAPGNEAVLRGKILSFTRPQATFELTSPGMDLDQLLVQQPKSPAAPASPVPAASAVPSAPASNYDAMLAPLRKSPAAAAATAAATVNIKWMKYGGNKLDDLSAKVAMRDLVASLDTFAFRLWNGTFKANGRFNLRPETPTYEFGTQIRDLNLREAVAMQSPLFKNTVLGIVNFSMDGSGASFNADAAKSSLKAKGNMKIEKAKFATIDVGRMASEALNKAIDRIAEKYPQIKGKQVGVPRGRESRYDLISSDFTLAGGKFSAPNFAAKAEANQGIDLKGKTTLGIVDYSLQSTWNVVDTYNLTRAANLDLEIAGQKVEHLLGNPVQFPVTVGCSLAEPCYSYTQVPEAIARVALANISHSLEGRAKVEAQKKAQELLQKASPQVQKEVQKGVEGLKKKLFK
jgi:hypothetical protein